MKQISWDKKTFFKKLGYRFLVESAKIENITFPNKTTLSEATVKTNRMGSKNWTYHKQRGFASNYQKPMLRQIEWRVQNEPITTNEVLPVINSFLWKFSLQKFQ